MKTYIGTKIIKATPMTDLEFEEEKRVFQSCKETVKAYKDGQNLLRSGGDLCASPSARRDPKDGYKVMYPDGYVSWSPKIAFENSYREVSQSEKEMVNV